MSDPSADEKRLAQLRHFLEEVDHGVTQPDAAFLLRLLDAAQARLLQAEQSRDAYERDKYDTAAQLFDCDKQRLAAEERVSALERDHIERLDLLGLEINALRNDLTATDRRASALAAVLCNAERMMFDYGKAIHLKDVGLKDEGEPIRAACLAWLETARAALAQSEAPKDGNAPQTAKSHESGDKG